MYRKLKKRWLLIDKLSNKPWQETLVQRVGIGLVTTSSALLFSSAVLAAQLAPPTLSLPTEGMVVSPGVQTQFDWSEVTSANTYRLQVALSADFAGVSADGKTCSTTNCVLNEKVDYKSSFLTTTPLPSGNYFGRVRAGNLDPATNLVASEWTTPRSLVVRLPPPQLSLPTDRQGFTLLTPTLDWSDVPLATTYRVQIANASSFQTQADGTNCSNCPVEYKVLGATSTYSVPSGKLVSGTYYWRVRAGSDTLVNSDWSSVYSFSILMLLFNRDTTSMPMVIP